jgi:hypothetical protein
MGAVAAIAEVFAAGAIGRFLNAEIGPDLLLQAELPGPGPRGVIAPEAAMGHRQRRIPLAFLIHS